MHLLEGRAGNRPNLARCVYPYRGIRYKHLGLVRENDV